MTCLGCVHFCPRLRPEGVMDWCALFATTPDIARDRIDKCGPGARHYRGKP
jgi:hypothetical protein